MNFRRSISGQQRKGKDKSAVRVSGSCQRKCRLLYFMSHDKYPRHQTLLAFWVQGYVRHLTTFAPSLGRLPFKCMKRQIHAKHLLYRKYPGRVRPARFIGEKEESSFLTSSLKTLTAASTFVTLYPFTPYSFWFFKDTFFKCLVLE